MIVEKKNEFWEKGTVVVPAYLVATLKDKQVSANSFSMCWGSPIALLTSLEEARKYREREINKEIRKDAKILKCEVVYLRTIEDSETEG